jgi:hypothetical protein
MSGDAKARGHQRWMTFYAFVWVGIVLAVDWWSDTGIICAMILIAASGVIQAMRDLHKEPRP